MPIPESPRRMPAVDCDGVQDTFPFDFLVFEDTDVRVVLLDTDTSVETELVLATDYTVTLNPDQDADPGGDVVTNDPPADNYTLTIIGGTSYAQPTALPDGGAYRAEQVELALDRLGVLTQQLKEEVDRCAQVPVSSEDAEELNDAINTLAANLDDLLIVVNNIADVITVADNIADVNTVAGIAADVTTVAGIAGDVVAVAANAANISAVAANEVNIDTVAGISADVTTVAGIATEVAAVAANEANINAVAANEANINAVAANEANINAAVAALPDLADKVSKTSATGSAVLPAGTTAQRDGSPAAGYTRFNTTTGFLEVYTGSTWRVSSVVDASTTVKGIVELATDA
jgi:hypothetical protein